MQVAGFAAGQDVGLERWHTGLIHGGRGHVDFPGPLRGTIVVDQMGVSPAARAEKAARRGRRAKRANLGLTCNVDLEPLRMLAGDAGLQREELRIEALEPSEILLADLP